MDNNRSTRSRRTIRDRREEGTRVRRCTRTALPECSRAITRRRHRRASTRGSRYVTIAVSGAGSISMGGRMTDDPVRSRRRHRFPLPRSPYASLALPILPAYSHSHIAWHMHSTLLPIESNSVNEEQPMYYGQQPMNQPNVVVQQQPRDSGPGCCAVCCGCLAALLWCVQSLSLVCRSRKCRKRGRANAFRNLDSRPTASTACSKQLHLSPRP